MQHPMGELLTETDFAVNCMYPCMFTREADMLIVAEKLHKLSFSALMEVYEEGNLENAQEMYPDCTRGQQLLRAEQDFYQYLSEIFFRTDGAAYLIWQERGQYLSALRLEPWEDGFLLEALETAPQFRRQGHAAALLEAMKLYAMQRGIQKIYSHVGKRNEASLRTHLSAGFEKILDHAVYADGSVMHNLYTLCLFL
jgi:GNAT superfamily N-acetyltransferase